MAGQEHAQGTRREDDGVGPEDSGVEAAQASAQQRDADVDALLDDIEDVLESNAEQFVRGFVQKGGQ
ncbi:ubiquitin-like protein Pup [Cellulomonas sp. NPDC089187]|uniref:ubiquitin-like protein Pup n=1 Tax=Cellulomonas sp. NPDC089187 TaxID=3154970 RepID=UPI00342690D6